MDTLPAELRQIADRYSMEIHEVFQSRSGASDVLNVEYSPGVPDAHSPAFEASVHSYWVAQGGDRNPFCRHVQFVNRWDAKTMTMGEHSRLTYENGRLTSEIESLEAEIATNRRAIEELVAECARLAGENEKLREAK